MSKRGSTLVTGVAGFIGYFVAQQLLKRGDAVVGLDNLNDYYDPELKRARLTQLQRSGSKSQFVFELANVVDAVAIERVFAQHSIDKCCASGRSSGCAPLNHAPAGLH